MKKICERLQKQMAEKGASSLRDDATAQEHIVGCTECFEFLEAHSVIDEILGENSKIDAPDSVVDELVAKVDELKSKSKDRKKIKTDSAYSSKKLLRFIVEIPVKYPGRFLSLIFQNRRVLAPCFVVLIICGLTFSVISPKMSVNKMEMESYKSDYAIEPEISYELSEPLPASAPEPVGSTSVSSKSPEKKKERRAVKKRLKRKARKRYPESGEGGRALQMKLRDIATEEEVVTEYDDLDDGIVERVREEEDEIADLLSIPETDSESKTIALKDMGADKLSYPVKKSNEKKVAGKLQNNQEFFKGGKELNKPGRKKISESVNEDTFSLQGGIYDAPSEKTPMPVITKSEVEKRNDSFGKNILENFFIERSSLENLSYKQAKGYWANTYLPGDPVYRWLDSQLAIGDRSPTGLNIDRKLELDGKARRITQPFDPPVTAALGVFLHADRRGIQGKSRMLVQVGIKGTQRFSGSRPGMNVGIVLDLRGDISEENINCFKSFLTAFSEAKDLGDRFSLIIAGRPGAVIIEPGNFKYGHLSVAVKQLFGNDAAKGETLGVVEAVRRAAEMVKSGDDPTAPLGSSEVILVTSQPMRGLVDNIAAIAHESAVGGSPVSVVGIGNKINPEELNRIIYSGQGNRRLFSQPVDAARVVEQELTAVSRIIARAVRLRIRLKRGVQLVNVIDSHRLDEINVKRIKAAEKSIDLRMAKNLGIKADRGDDEDGIQIVIPSFYANDSHVVLLDVVAEGPGPIADVTIRYKDLVKLKNGVARANLSLDRSGEVPGHLERNVLKNFLAGKLSKALSDAGEALSTGDDKQAVNLLQIHRNLLSAIKKNQPGFQRDRDISDDIAMLNGYLGVLKKGITKERDYIANSLKFAGKLKVLPRLNE